MIPSNTLSNTVSEPLYGPYDPRIKSLTNEPEMMFESLRAAITRVFKRSFRRVRDRYQSFQMMSKTQLLLIILVIGASIILGFLSFSGMYVLLPILAVGVVAYVLSVGFEGEIYYRNMMGALEKLFKPNYLKRQLAKECLRDLLCKIEVKEHLKLIIHKLDKTDDDSESFYDSYKTFLELYERVMDGKKSVQKTIPYTLNEFQHLSALDVVELNNAREIVRAVKSKEPKGLPGLVTLLLPKEDRDNLSAAESKIKELEKSRRKLSKSLTAVLNELEPAKNDYPDFFYDYMKFTRLHHQYNDQPNLVALSKIQKKELEDNLDTLSELFRTQLFLDHKAPRIINVAKDFTVIQKQDDLTDDVIGQYVFLEEKAAVFKICKKGDKLIPQPVSRDEFTGIYTQLSISEQETLDTLLYKAHLHIFLNLHREKWQSKLDERSLLFGVAKAGCTLAGLFMVFGTTYLLVEAFAVIPLLATIPLGVWPALIVPMAIIAGTAFGLLTYNAVTDMINDDVILKRYRKIRQDLKKGVTLSTGFMMVVTVSLFALTLALTICTGGTWWTVIKHTRPLFTWMGKMPVVIIGIVAAILGVAQFVFNATNTLETLEEFDEEVGPHPSDLALLSIKVDEELPAPSDKPTLIKHGDTYYVDGKSSGCDIHYLSSKPDFTKYNNSYVWIAGEELVYVNWNGTVDQVPINDHKLLQRDLTDANPKALDKIHLSDEKIAIRITANGGYRQSGPRTELNSAAVRQIDFSKKILPYSVMNIRLYFAIWYNKTRTFEPSNETFWQKANPFRILLKLTYTPLRLGLFFGHLISIGAVSDRVPGIPEILSAILGILAEFFEDWHYFFSFEHAHKEDIGSLMDEQDESTEHNHDDDIPTKALRALFYPLIYMAAWWDSAASDRKEYRHRDLDLASEESYAKLFDTLGERPELDFEHAFEKNQGIKPAVAIPLNETSFALLKLTSEEFLQLEAALIDKTLIKLATKDNYKDVSFTISQVERLKRALLTKISRKELSDISKQELSKVSRKLVLTYLASAQYDPDEDLALAQYVSDETPNDVVQSESPINATPIHLDVTPRLIKNLATMASRRSSEDKELIKFSIFKCCDTPHFNQHTLLNQHVPQPSQM